MESRAATNYLLALMLACLIALTYIEGTRFKEESIQFKRAEGLNLSLRQASNRLGAQLAILNSTYDETVYRSPETKTIMQQQFLVTEHLYQLLQLIALQNQAVVAAQAGDPKMIENTTETLDKFTEILNSK